jgi:hypothetical protein
MTKMICQSTNAPKSAKTDVKTRTCALGAFGFAPGPVVFAKIQRSVDWQTGNRCSADNKKLEGLIHLIHTFAIACGVFVKLFFVTVKRRMTTVSSRLTDDDMSL